jgi:hypothetical protein
MSNQKLDCSSRQNSSCSNTIIIAEMKFTDESAMDYMNEQFPALMLAQSKSPNWKERLEGTKWLMKQCISF